MNVSLAVRTLLQGRVGLSPSTLSNATYETAIDARLTATRLSREAWYERLQHDESELDALIEAMVVPETWFFRDEIPFVETARYAARRTPDERNPFRVLTLPCATGEETYSVAIALREIGLRPTQFRVDGIDISTTALARAAAGIYRNVSFRSPRAEAAKAGWFVANGDTFSLVPSARESVHFRRGNAIDPQTFATQPSYDVIFCRNLLIYFDLPARKALVDALRTKLSIGGLLFVGHAESLVGFDQGLRRLPDVRAFGYERMEQDASPSLAPALPKPTVRPTTMRAASTRPRAPSTPSPRRSSHPAPAPDPLVAARALADRGELAQAKLLVEATLKTPTADAFHLLGVIAQSENRLEDAERCFTKALYVDPTHYSSLMHMALLRERRGDPAAAQFRARATRPRRGDGES